MFSRRIPPPLIRRLTPPQLQIENGKEQMMPTAKTFWADTQVCTLRCLRQSLCGADAIRPLRKKFLPRSQTTSRPLLEGGARRAGVGIKRQAYACAYDGLAPMLMGDQGRRLRQAPLAINNCFPTVSQPFLNCFPIICHLIFARFAIALLSLCYCFAATSKFVSSTI